MNSSEKNKPYFSDEMTLGCTRYRGTAIIYMERK